MVRRSTLVSVAALVFGLAASSSNSSTTLPSLSASIQPPVTGSPSAPPGDGTHCAASAPAADVPAIVGETATAPTPASSNALPGLPSPRGAYVAHAGTE